MLTQQNKSAKFGIFITLAGNCKEAFTFYQSCFGGELSFEILEMPLNQYPNKPVISGSLISERIVLHGSDLVHDEGYQKGNHLAIYFPCLNISERYRLIIQLVGDIKEPSLETKKQRLIEITDLFGVRWILGLVHEK
ncbi:glyoxalase [Chryseobacterium sp. T16E-39]|uniref:VOC family protein n=1 Tax=Chryseobacterium sp. T16E-39 TaxID=2015076 RepID=UPI000B5B2EB8|nr:glyoxalase [Chryseobacterium sp. T16E-39]ASK31191.1 glyoxalase [Chryseobacterium sp. T16E-39]